MTSILFQSSLLQNNTHINFSCREDVNGGVEMKKCKNIMGNEMFMVGTMRCEKERR